SRPGAGPPSPSPLEWQNPRRKRSFPVVLPALREGLFQLLLVVVRLDLHPPQVGPPEPPLITTPSATPALARRPSSARRPLNLPAHTPRARSRRPKPRGPPSTSPGRLGSPAGMPAKDPGPRYSVKTLNEG